MCNLYYTSEQSILILRFNSPELQKRERGDLGQKVKSAFLDGCLYVAFLVVLGVSCEDRYADGDTYVIY